MSLYLFQNNQQTGPFTDLQVNQMIQSGTLTPDTLCWKEGMPTWVAVSTLNLPPVPGAIPPPPVPIAKSSALGVFSFAYGLISLAGWAILFIVAGLAHNNGTATQTFNMIVGFILMGGFALNFMAMVAGIVGAFKSRANTLAIMGASLNGFELLAVVVLIVIGLAAAGAHLAN